MVNASQDHTGISDTGLIHGYQAEKALLGFTPCIQDRGSQYASELYQTLLERNGILCSMSGKGNCWDNAVMESFYRTLKIELIYQRNYQTRIEAQRDIFEYIEIFYNRERLHSSLGYYSTEEYEKMIRVS